MEATTFLPIGMGLIVLGAGLGRNPPNTSS